jgi:hypothetical protein
MKITGIFHSHYPAKLQWNNLLAEVYSTIPYGTLLEPYPGPLRLALLCDGSPSIILYLSLLNNWYSKGGSGQILMYDST